MAEMDQQVKQILAMAGELHGLVDKLENEAQAVAARAGKQKTAAADYDKLLKQISEAQVTLDGKKAEMARADQARMALRELALKM